MTDFLLLAYFCSMHQHSIPFYVQITFHRYTVFICWWALGFFPTFWLLQIMLLWNFGIFSVNMCFLGVCLGLVDHVVTLRVTIRGTAKLFFKVAAPFYSFTSSIWEFQCVYILPNLLLSAVFILVIPDTMKWYLIVVLIGTSLVANDVEHLSMR